MGESTNSLKVQFDRRVRVEFHGATITSDAGLLAARELGGALGLTELSIDHLKDTRTGRNVQHQLAPLLRQSVYGRLAGYEDTNDAERLAQASHAGHCGLVGSRWCNKLPWTPIWVLT